MITIKEEDGKIFYIKDECGLHMICANRYRLCAICKHHNSKNKYSQFIKKEKTK